MQKKKNLPSDVDPEEFGLQREKDKELLAYIRRERSVPSVIRQLWNPKSLPSPVIDGDFRYMSWLERCAEVIRYTFLCLEHWLSQSGVLREWLRLNLWVAVFLFSAAILIIPAVTAVLQGAVEFTGLFGRIVENVTAAILKLPPVVLGIATLMLLFRLLYRQWQRRRHSRLDYDPPDYREY